MINNMTLKDAYEGEKYIIQQINTDDEELNSFLLFFASYFSKKLQNVFGECCISNLEKVAAAVPEPSGIGTDHCIHFLLSYSV